jgi:hypothetical protein
MTLLSVAEFRRAAQQARIIAKGLADPNAKKRFMDPADKWEMEAAALELTAVDRFHGIGSGGL